MLKRNIFNLVLVLANLALFSGNSVAKAPFVSPEAIRGAHTAPETVATAEVNETGNEWIVLRPNIVRFLPADDRLRDEMLARIFINNLRLEDGMWRR